MTLTSAFLSGHLNFNQEIKVPQFEKKEVTLPTSRNFTIKKFIVHTPEEILDPGYTKKEIEEPIKKQIKKHAVRMIVLRRKKMKKHQLKKLWKRMYLKFKAVRVRREKKKELTFRYMLIEKVKEARKFDPEKYVLDYLADYHTPLLPKTYKGMRKPAWLIKELLEKDIQDHKDKDMEGRSFTTKEKLVLPGETVEEFTKRTLNKL